MVRSRVAGTRRPAHSRRAVITTAVVMFLIAACLVGSVHLVGRCWLGVDCGPVSETGRLDSVLVGRDGRILSIRHSFPCSGTDTLTATEWPDRVVLADVWTGPTHPPGCTAAMGIGTWSVRLATPLGGRALIDAATGRPVSWIGGPTLRYPGYLPAGYVLSDRGSLPPPLLDINIETACYMSLFTPTSGAVVGLIVTQCAGRLVPATARENSGVQVLGHVPIDGTTAQIRDTDECRGLVWMAGDRSYIVATNITEAGQRLADATLISVANSLR